MANIIKRALIFSISCLFLLTACKYKTGNKHVRLNLKLDNIATSQDVATTSDIIKNRLLAYGLPEKNIHLSIQNKMVFLDVEHADIPERIISLATMSGKIEFWETFEFEDVYTYLEQANKKAAEIQNQSNNTGDPSKLTTKKAPDKKKNIANQDTNSLIYKSGNKEKVKQENIEAYNKENPLFAYLQPAFVQGETGMTYSAGPVVGYCKIEDTAKVNKIFALQEVMAFMPRNMKFLWGNSSVDKNKTLLSLTAIKLRLDEKAPINGSYIIEAKSEKGPGGMYEISLKMNNEGARIWKRLTQDNIGLSIAIVLNNFVFASPKVMSTIENGNSTISGNFTKEEAEDLATILKYPHFPVPITLVDSKITDESK